MSVQKYSRFILVLIFIASVCSAQTNLNQLISEQKLHYLSLKSELFKVIQLQNVFINEFQNSYQTSLNSVSADSMINALHPQYELKSPYSRNALELHADRLVMRNQGIEYYITVITQQQHNMITMYNLLHEREMNLLQQRQQLASVQLQLDDCRSAQYAKKSIKMNTLLWPFITGLLAGGLVGALIF